LRRMESTLEFGEDIVVGSCGRAFDGVIGGAMKRVS